MKQSPRSPAELIARYPYQFASQPDGGEADVSFPRGWFKGFADLCESIDIVLGNDKRGFRWVQTKEKMGSASYYWHLDDKDGVNAQLARVIAALVAAACKTTSVLCIRCGKPAMIKSLDGCLLAICDDHDTDRQTVPFYLGLKDEVCE